MRDLTFEEHREIILVFVQARRFTEALDRLTVFTHARWGKHSFQIDLLRFQTVSAYLAFSDKISHAEITHVGCVDNKELRYALARQMVIYGLLKKDIVAARYGLSLLPVSKDLVYMYFQVRALMIESNMKHESIEAIEAITADMIQVQEKLTLLAQEEALLFQKQQ